MNITEGLEIKENQFVNWGVSFEEFIVICRANNIDYQLETQDAVKKISLLIKFANLGKIQANVWFINGSIKEVYITSSTDTEFHIDKYLNVNDKLILYFGTPKHQSKRKTVWEFNKIRIKHFYIVKEDDIAMDYLVLENHYR